MEIVVVALVAVVAVQSALLAATFRTLLRAAMSRTPGEFRRLEQEARKPKAEPPTQVSQVDEAAAMVLESIQATMPHGLGGA